MPIEIFTDGSSRGNPGPGGYGVILRCGEHYKELSGGFAETTNNRMELTAVIVGLEAVKRPNAEIILYSDSRYVVDSVNKGWVFGWERKRFEKRLNADLWIRFLEVYRRHRVRFVWVKGHADNPMNNRCDQLNSAEIAEFYGSGNAVSESLLTFAALIIKDVICCREIK